MGEPARAARPGSRGPVFAIFAIALLVPVSAVVFLLTQAGKHAQVHLDLASPCEQLDPSTLSLLAPGGTATPTESGSDTSATRHCAVDTTGRDLEVDVRADGTQFTTQWRADRCSEIGGEPQRSNAHVVCSSQRHQAGQTRIDSYTWVEGVYQVHVTYQRVPADQVPDDVGAALDALVAKVVAALPVSASS